MTIYGSTTIFNELKLKAIASIIASYFAQYSVGSRVYILEVAQKKGQLQSVVIKRHWLDNLGAVVYKDTLNRIWFEPELCSHAIAKDYAITYWESLSEAYLHS